MIQEFFAGGGEFSGVARWWCVDSGKIAEARKSESRANRKRR
jgi:hypothetical protein